MGALAPSAPAREAQDAAAFRRSSGDTNRGSATILGPARGTPGHRNRAHGRGAVARTDYA